MPHIKREDLEFLRQFASADGFSCECAPGESHEIEATDWRHIVSILEQVLGDTAR